MSTTLFAPTKRAATPKAGLPFALATWLLDAILALTWTFVERPRRIEPWAPTGRILPDRFQCVACEQLWSIPAGLRQTFVFRCDCGERMIVHVG